MFLPVRFRWPSSLVVPHGATYRRVCGYRVPRAPSYSARGFTHCPLRCTNLYMLVISFSERATFAAAVLRSVAHCKRPNKSRCSVSNAVCYGAAAAVQLPASPVTSEAASAARGPLALLLSQCLAAPATLAQRVRSRSWRSIAPSSCCREVNPPCILALFALTWPFTEPIL